VTRFALRGSPADYDEWDALGNAGWGFKDLLPYFTRLEVDADFGDQPWHGDRGPMPISRYLDLELIRSERPGCWRWRRWVSRSSRITTDRAQSAPGGCR
jgi:choline dehydrogenase-like flavoprotein